MDKSARTWEERTRRTETLPYASLPILSPSLSYVHTYTHMTVCAKLLQSYRTLCDSMGYSPPASSAHGILQTRILEWVSMPSSRGFAQPRDQACMSCSSCIAGRFFPAEPPVKPPHTHTHSLTHRHPPSHPLTHIHSHTPTHSLTHIHTHTHILTNTHTHTLSHTHIHTHTHTLSYTHTLTHTELNSSLR